MIVLLAFMWITSANMVLKVGLTQEFENLNPLLNTMSVTDYIYSMVGRPLVAFGGNGRLKARLVRRIPTLKNGLAKITEKGLRADWEIRPQAKWGDGVPITGHDVLFTWQVALHKNVAVANRKSFERIKDIRVNPTDPKKFTIFYKEAQWDFNRSLIYLLPKHLEEPLFQKHKRVAQGYDKNSLYTARSVTAGLYNGPYRISELKFGSHVTLVPNEHFYGSRPKIKKIILKLIPNTGTLESNILAGNIDMISIFGMSLDQALKFEKKIQRKKLPWRVNIKAATIYEHIDLRLDNPILRDIRVRRALLYALDRKKLSAALFAGRQPAAMHNIPPGDSWYTEDPGEVFLYRPSRKKARELLEQAGWKKGKDGYRYKDGKKLSLRLMSTSGHKLRETVQIYLQNRWKKVGVEITVKNEPPRVFFGQTVRKARFPAMAMYGRASYPEMSVYTRYHSAHIPTAQNGWSGYNRSKWVNPEVDRILAEIEVSFDAAKRKKLARRFLYHYTRELPAIPLYYSSRISVTPRRLKGYTLSQFLSNPALEVENWELL